MKKTLKVIIILQSLRTTGGFSFCFLVCLEVNLYNLGLPRKSRCRNDLSSAQVSVSASPSLKLPEKRGMLCYNAKTFITLGQNNKLDTVTEVYRAELEVCDRRVSVLQCPNLQPEKRGTLLCYIAKTFIKLGQNNKLHTVTEVYRAELEVCDRRVSVLQCPSLQPEKRGALRVTMNIAKTFITLGQTNKLDTVTEVYRAELEVCDRRVSVLQCPSLQPEKRGILCYNKYCKNIYHAGTN